MTARPTRQEKLRLLPFLKQDAQISDEWLDVLLEVKEGADLWVAIVRRKSLTEQRRMIQSLLLSDRRVHEKQRTFIARFFAGANAPRRTPAEDFDAIAAAKEYESAVQLLSRGSRRTEVRIEVERTLCEKWDCPPASLRHAVKLHGTLSKG